MSGSRSHVLSGLIGLVVGMVIVAVLPATAGDGESLTLGEKNAAKTVTRLNTRGGLRIDNFKAGNPALILNVADPTSAPFQVNATGMVGNLNADLVDGVDASAFAGGSAVLGTGLPSLGFGCLHQGGHLLAFSRDGSPVCTAPDGTAKFTDSGQSLGTYGTFGVALGDLDGDGDLDAFTANSTEANRVWINDGTGTFTDSGQTLDTSSTFGVALGDLDGDGDLDVYASKQWGAGNRVWMNDGTGTFTDSGQSLGTGFTEGAALGDLDGDGDLDACTANQDSQGNRVWLNDGTGTFTDSGQNLGVHSTFEVALGDLDGDGDLDLYTANYVPGNRVWLNDGTGTFTDTGQSLGPGDTLGVALGDLDGDGDLDAYTANSGSEVNRVWLNDGTGTFTDSGQSLGTSGTYGVALGDFDGDGDLDAFTANTSSGPIGANLVWINNGSGSFTDSGLTLGTNSSRRVALGDLDGDGDLDAFTTNYGVGNRVWENG